MRLVAAGCRRHLNLTVVFNDTCNVPGPVMRRAASPLEGMHNFCFSAAGGRPVASRYPSTFGTGRQARKDANVA